MSRKTFYAGMAGGIVATVLVVAGMKGLEARPAIAGSTATATPHVAAAIRASAVGMLTSNNATSTLVVHPGETTGSLNATGCESSSGQGYGLGNGLACIPCSSNCTSIDTNTANAAIHGSGNNTQPPQTFSVSSPWVDFELSSTPETEGNLIPCSINYSAEWKGEWTRFGVFTGGTSAEIKISLSLHDMTDDVPVASHEIHSEKPEGADFDLFEIGAWINHDTKTDSFVAMLKRGHEYRLKYTLRLESTSFGNTYVVLDYQTGGWGAWWNELTISAAEDPEDLVAELREELLNLIENHTHPYLTGRGAGHNNKEAISGAAILPE